MKITEQILNICRGEKKEDREENNKEKINKVMELEIKDPPHEKLKKDLIAKFTPQSTYIGSHVRKVLMDSDFKVLKENSQPPKYIKKGDVIVLPQGKKNRPTVVAKVLKDRTIVVIGITSTNNIHCQTPFKSRFFGDGCFCKGFDVCDEEKVIQNFIGVFDNTKALNQAIKDLKNFVGNSI